MATITGTPNNDGRGGTAGPDVIDGGQGSDTLTGGGGDDIITGGDGSDLVFGDGSLNVVRVSVGTNGAQGNNQVEDTPALSADGSKVVYTSRASNISDGDTNNLTDVFVRDLTTGVTTRVSTDSNGGLATGGSSRAGEFSPDGTKVLFYSASNTLVAGDTNGQFDVFVKDLITGQTTRVSTTADGLEAVGGQSVRAQFSPDGTKVLFDSAATNLVAGDTNGTSDVFVKDLATGTVTRISVGANGEQVMGSNVIADWSADGNSVAFISSASGGIVAPGADTNNDFDVYVKNLSTGTLTRASVNAAGEGANAGSFAPRLSPDGTKVYFESNASNLVAGDTNGVADIFMKDLTTGAVTRVSAAPGGVQANGYSYSPALSPDGTMIAFESGATNLVAGDTNSRGDIFVVNLATGAVTRASVGPDGAQVLGGSYLVTWGANGQLTFHSAAAELVPGDTNGFADTFVTAGVSGNDNISGGLGNDQLYGDAGNDLLSGGDGSDLLIGGSGNDALYGDEGDDLMGGRTGADLMIGGGGNDAVYGDEGDDVMGGRVGQDYLTGGAGRDSLYGDEDNDALYGDEGDDALFGGAGADLMIGGTGLDYLVGGVGDDIMGGREDADLLVGEDGNDALYGDAGDDLLGGRAGTDYLVGGDGKDGLYGDDGNDVLIGSAGADELFGGAGADRFTFTALSDSTLTLSDRLIDFSRAQGDIVDLSAIDANTAAAGDQAFVMVQAFSNQAGQAVLTYNGQFTTLQLDVNGDGQADFQAFIAGQVTSTEGWVL